MAYKPRDRITNTDIVLQERYQLNQTDNSMARVLITLVRQGGGLSRQGPGFGSRSRRFVRNKKCFFPIHVWKTVLRGASVTET